MITPLHYTPNGSNQIRVTNFTHLYRKLKATNTPAINAIKYVKLKKVNDKMFKMQKKNELRTV